MGQTVRDQSIFLRPSTYAIGSLFLTILSSATTLAAPQLLSEHDFAAFVLLASFFQLAARFDFGLSERADQYGAGRGNQAEARQNLVAARFAIALIVMVIALSLILSFDFVSAAISKIDLLLALSGGLLAMISVGPVTIARSRNDIRSFTKLALALQLGMTIPRLLGLLASGTTGCYSALLAWYLLFAIRSLRSLKGTAFDMKAFSDEIGKSIPLFTFSTLWLCYQFSARWISASISNPEIFSTLAFAFNLLAVMTGTVTTIGQAYYPRFLSLMEKREQKAISILFRKDTIALLSGLFCALLLGLPLLPLGLSYFYLKHLPYLANIYVVTIAIIPLSLSLWFIPLITAITRRPLTDTFIVLIPSFLSLFALMGLGNRWAGASGQAHGILFASFTPLILMFGLLYHYKIARAHSALYFLILPTLMTGMLFLEIETVL